MRLTPVLPFQGPEYPARASRLGRSLRRGLAAAGAAALLAGVSCGPRPGPDPVRPPGEPPAVLTPADTSRQAAGDAGVQKESAAPRPAARDLAWCQFTPRLSGSRMLNEIFVCAPSPPASLAPRPLSRGVVDGRACPGQPAWARIRVDAPTRVSISYDQPNVDLAVIAPDGSRVAELGRGRSCVTLTMEPGVWLAAATLRERPGPERGGFELWFDPADRSQPPAP